MLEKLKKSVCFQEEVIADIAVWMLFHPYENNASANISALVMPKIPSLLIETTFLVLPTFAGSRRPGRSDLRCCERARSQSMTFPGAEL